MASVRGRRTQTGLWLSFLAGCTLGGALTGAALGLLSGLLSPIPLAVRLVLIAAIAVALAGLDLASPALRLPQRTRLIPQEVFAAGMARGGFRFGVEYGCGFRTLIPSAAPYIVAGFLLLAGVSWWWAVALGAGFGAARSAAVLQFLLLGRPGWQRFLSEHTRVLERAGAGLTAVLVIWAALSRWG